jgi:RHS repeat-associated protein
MFYGVTSSGGTYSFGTIFRFNPLNNSLAAMRHFTGPDGAMPEGGFVEGLEGWLYGVTRQGGNSMTVSDPGKGTVFQYKPSTNQFNIIHHFNGGNGAAPCAALVRGSDGRIYGTMSEGGPTNPAFGGVFVVLPTKTTATAQTASILGTYYFRNSTGLAPNGRRPFSSLVEASKGTLYGTCSRGGANDQGALFTFGMGSRTISLVTSFKGYTNSFSPYTGSFPLAGISVGPDGVIYGTCSEGGSSSLYKGTLWQYRPSTRQLSRLHDFATSADFTLPRTAFSLAPDSALYATADHGLYRVLLAGKVPVVSAPTASLITSTGAKLTSTITPGGLVTRWWYEYGTSAAALNQRTPEQIIWNGVLNFSASLSLSALAPHTTYYYRLVTSNPQGTTYGLTKTFKTPNTVPIARPDHFGVGSSAITFDVIANDSDADNDALTITAVTQGKYGTITFAGRSILYTPKTTYPPRDTFTYTLSDGFGGTAKATVSTHEIYNPNADDKYVQWAKSKWGTDIALNPIMKDTVWGESADPDKDGVKNLVEYAFNLNPLVNDKTSMPTATIIKPTSLTRGSITYQLTQRADDPALAIIPQVSYDARTWNPRAPTTSLGWTGDGVWFFKGSLDPTIVNGYQQMIHAHSFTAANAFARLTVLRNTATVTNPGVAPFSFTSQPSVATGSTARSSAIVLGGFVGNVTLNIPAGVTLFVNGIAKTGSSATVKAGDTLWMQATAPGTAGVPRSYTLTIGGQSATWSFTTTAMNTAVPDHPGTDSGYTPVETGVSDTGAAQISIPIVVSPGTAGMQPKLSINYSSQGGNGPLGVGFSLSGLSTISRVGRTVAQDGVKGGVNFDANDRFALDGQRLIAINGADGADGTEYRLEFDPTTRLRSYSANGASPTYWTVETKSGLIMRFGETANSQLRPVFDGKGFVKNDWYYQVAARSGVAGLISIPSYPDSPLISIYTDTLAGRLSYAKHCGQRMRGYLVPKVSGTYQFKVEGTYDAALNLNPAGISEGGLTRIANAGGTFATFNLNAGQKYLIEALHYIYNGVQYIRPYWKGPGIPEGSNGEFTTVVSGDYLEAEPPSPTSEAPIASWPISSTIDTLGNAMRYEYDSAGLAEGVALISKISYTENTARGLAAGSDVVFHYQDRPDTRSQFYPNNRREHSFLGRVLRQIQTRRLVLGAPQIIRSYDFDWSQSNLTNRSVLTKVRESAGTVYHDTDFAWGSQVLANYASALEPVPTIPSQWNIANAQTADFNGDGRADLFSFGTDGSFTVLLKRESNGFDTLRTFPDSGFNPAAFWLLDTNSDGRTDLITRPATNNTRIITYLSNESGGFRSIISDPRVAWNLGGVATGDINGDGRTDFVAGLQTSVIRSFISNGDGTFRLADATQGMTDTASTLFQGDFNGDGMMDFVSNRQTSKYEAANYLTIHLSLGNGTFETRSIPYSKDFGGVTGSLIVGDFNGDSISDLAKLDPGFVTVFLLDSYQVRKVSKTPHTFSGLVIRPDWVGNFNTDESADLFGWDSNVSTMVRFIAKGDGTFNIVSQANPSPTTCRQGFTWLGDFDGDGKSEPVSENNQLTLFAAPVAVSFNEDVVIRVQNAHLGETRFAYGPLTRGTLHTKGSGLVPPCLDFQAPMYVISSMTSRNGIDGDGFTGAGTSTLGENTVTYRYEGAWSCLDGRGFMGFKAVVTTDATSGIVTRTEYESSSPLLGGRVKHTEQRLLTAPVGGSSLICESDTTWSIATTTNVGHPNTYFVAESSSASNAYEVNRPAGSALVKTETRNGFSYDTYANLLTSTTTTSGTETFTETVTNTYADAPTASQWHLGRLVTSSVTKTGPNPTGGADITIPRSSSFAYHPTTGLLTQEVIEPSGGILRQQKDYTHDGFGNILTSTISTSGAASRTTTTTYTPDGRFVATTTNALNHTETKTYDPLLGNVLTQTGPNGLTTSWEYDAIGRPIQENRPDGTVTRSFYRRVTGSTVGAPPRAVHYVRVQSSGGAPKTVWYDLLDREIRADGIAFDGRTVSSHKVFNNRGEVTHASQPYFAGDTPLYSQMLYDAVGREYQQTDPGNRVSKTTYDGLTTTVERNYNPAVPTDFQKAVTMVNAMGWTVQSSQYLGTAAKTITRKYDPYGNLRFVTDPATNTTELRYDVRGNKTWMSEPNSGTSTFTYNGFGELKTQTNNANQTVSLSYDKLGRVLTRTEPEGVTTFEYDSAAQGVGQLARESSGDFVRSYFYDHLSRPVSTVESHGFHSFAVSRSHDGYGRPDAMTYPTGLATRQVYTANGHLSEVQNAANPLQRYWRVLAVNARGQITQEVQGNGVVTDRAFDAATGLISVITSTFGVVGDVQMSVFNFDLIGNLTQRQDRRYSTIFRETFGYDTLNRLQTVTTTGAAAVTAAYNDLGNITSRTDVGSFSYGAASTGPHALTGVTGGAFNKSCGYDAKGNRTTDGATSLTYSSFNKPVRMVKGGDTLRFDYGPDRALYRQTTFLTQTGGATSQTVREYIGGLYERETTSEGLVRHVHYIAGGSGVAAILTDERSASTTAQRTRYIHKDHLGSVDVITDSAGAVVERQSFDAWGRRRTVAYNTGTATWSVTYPTTPGSAETHRGFTGHEMLDAVGLVHMGGRIYDPITARFLSPDPFVQSPDNLQNLNRYSYVLNNPLSFTDPSGFFFKKLGKLFKTVAKMVVQHVVGNVFGSIGFVIAGPAGFAAGYGFGSAFSGTLLAGGSVGDALRAGLIGGVSARLTYGVGSAFESKALAPYSALKPIVHGAAQGGIRVAQGGKFTHGFVSGTFASQFEGAANTAESVAGSIWAGRAVAAVVGGTAEVVGGGKFGNGAMTGAFIRMFNDESHRGEDGESLGRVESIFEKIGFVSDSIESVMEQLVKSSKTDSVLKNMALVHEKAFGHVGLLFGSGEAAIAFAKAYESPSFRTFGEAYISAVSNLGWAGAALGYGYSYASNPQRIDAWTSKPRYIGPTIQGCSRTTGYCAPPMPVYGR